MDCMPRGSNQRRSGSRDLSLEQAGQAAVGEGLAAGLAGRAVLECGVGERDLPDRVAADQAGLAGLAVYPQAVEGCDLYYGDVIGDGVPLIGYENDGCVLAFGDDGLPRPEARLGVPADLEIIALAPAAFGEASDSPYRPLIPPEQLDVAAEVAYGDASPATQQRVLRGHAVMASFQRGKGEVFNGGTTEWAYGLAAGDPFITRITLNVLRRFGAL